MTDEEKRQHRCCFTGHRPEKLTQSKRQVCEQLKKEILQAIADGFYVFITGMSRGVDLWAAELVIKAKRKNKDIKLVCESPYVGFEDKWDYEWYSLYHNDNVLNKADFIKFVSPCYDLSCFQKRNMWMIDRSARIIAVYNGEKGGTRNAINYAQKQGIEICITK